LSTPIITTIAAVPFSSPLSPTAAIVTPAGAAAAAAHRPDGHRDANGDRVVIRCTDRDWDWLKSVRLDVDNRLDQLVGQDICWSSIHDRWRRTHRTTGSKISAAADGGGGPRSRRARGTKLTLLKRCKTKLSTTTTTTTTTTKTTCSIAIGESGPNTIGLEVVDKRVVELDRRLEDQVREDARGWDDLGFAAKMDRLRRNRKVRRRGDAVKTYTGSSVKKV
jgi:hypothetical protein